MELFGTLTSNSLIETQNLIALLVLHEEELNAVSFYLNF